MVFTSEPNTNMQLLTTMEKVKCWVSTSVEGWSKETAYFRYVQGLMQPVIVLMSSYRNRKRPSFKSSIILKQSNKERKRSTCTVGYEYKGVCSCHSSSSTWFYTQPIMTVEKQYGPFLNLFWSILLDTGEEVVFRIRVARVLWKVELLHLINSDKWKDVFREDL